MKKILDLSALVVVTVFLFAGCLSDDLYTVALPDRMAVGTDEPPTGEPPDGPLQIKPPVLVDIPDPPVKPDSVEVDTLCGNGKKALFRGACVPTPYPEPDTIPVVILPDPEPDTILVVIPSDLVPDMVPVPGPVTIPTKNPTVVVWGDDSTPIIDTPSSGSDIVVPPPVVVPITVIPPEIRETFEKDMPVYSGDTPPDISGQYLANNFTLVASTLSHDRIGGTGWADLYVAFIKGSDGKISYKSRNGTSQKSSDVIEIVGSNNNFTAYFVESGTSYGIYVKQSTIVSGTLTSSGISNFQYAFIMLEKGPDPGGVLVPVNTYRVFKDGDGMASKYNWLSKKAQSPDLERRGLLEQLVNSQR